MGRFLRNVILAYGLILAAVLAYLICIEYYNFRNVIGNMENTVILGNEYAVSSTQDLEAYTKIITGGTLDNPSAEYNYSEWLSAMSEYRSITIDKSGSITKSAQLPGVDNVFTEDFIEFLSSDIASEMGYSPLNFGISYLDQVKINTDMRDYLVKTITEIDRFKDINQFGGYSIDPRTIVVDSEITAKPVNIDMSPDYVQQLFGAKAPVEIEKNLKASESKTMVVYDIKYFIRFDYIPTSNIFNVSKSNQVNFEPKDLFFLKYETDPITGNSVGLNMPRVKWLMSDDGSYEYSFRYTMTH